jgi:BirA family biotin operon repressor/biotin-[acetyl-CoA-carboxylase] ligase
VKIIKLNAIDSTNTYLKSLTKNVSLEDEVVVVAQNQTNGRGQMGAEWQSKTGQSLTFSMFKKFFNVELSCQSYISFAVAIGIKKGLKKLQIPSVSIKWPNDILSYNKKVCGVLIENKIEGTKITGSIVGIGLNVNETEFKDLPQATSLFLATGVKLDLQEVLQILSETIFEELKRMSINNYDSLKEEYENELYRKDQVSAFEYPNGERINGMIKGVTQLGELLVEKENETIDKFEVKQIKMLY